MTHECKTRAAILMLEAFKEHGALVTCYTKQKGLLSARALGLKKPSSKLAPSIMPGNIVYMTLVKRQGWHITGAKAVHSISFELARGRRFSLSSAVREIIAYAYSHEHQDPGVFELLEKYLLFIKDRNVSEKIMTVATYRFLTLLFSHLGYAPHIDVCQEGGEKLLKGAPIFWGKTKGFICERCKDAFFANKTVLPVHESVKKVFNNNRHEISLPSFQEQDLLLWKTILSDVYENEQERSIVSWSP